MSFQPLVGQGGYAGWRLLARTGEAQKALVARDPQVARDTALVRKENKSYGKRYSCLTLLPLYSN